MKCVVFYLFCLNTLMVQAKDTITVNATGTYLLYRPSLDAGRGILFTFSIPKKKLKNANIESVYINKKAYPYTIRKQADSLFIQVNYFIANQQDLIQQQPKSQDPLLDSNQFYPSWILLKQKKRFHKINITYFHPLPLQIHS